MNRRALVTDGAERSSLAVVRSLGRSGYQVEVAAAQLPCLAGRSKWSTYSHQVPDPFVNADEYLRRVREIANAGKFDVVLPMSDASMSLLLEEHETDLTRHIPFGPYGAFATLSDKLAVLELAREVGLAVPQTRVIHSIDDLENGGLDHNSFPLVVKPHRSIIRVEHGLAKLGVVRVETFDALYDRLRGLPASGFPVLLQRPVAGRGTGVFLLTWNGRLLAHFAHKRIREKPPSGGVSVYREAILPDGELLSRAHQLVASTGWNGVSMLELKGHAGSREAAVMEVNARFWGSLQLAIDAGVDFPRLLAETADQESVSRSRIYRTGVRSRWFWGDVDQLLVRLRGSDDRDAKATGLIDRLRAIGEFIVPRPFRDRLEVGRLSDFRPFLYETKRWPERFG